LCVFVVTWPSIDVAVTVYECGPRLDVSSTLTFGPPPS